MYTSGEINPLAHYVHFVVQGRMSFSFVNRAALNYVIVPYRSFDIIFALAPGLSLVLVQQDLLALVNLLSRENCQR